MKQLILLLSLCLPASAQLLVVGYTNDVQLTTQTNGDLYADGRQVAVVGQPADGSAWTNLHRSQIVDLGDADTNSILSSPRFTYWTTNALNLTNAVRYQLPITVTNPESVSWSALAGYVGLYWAPAGTTNWNLGQITTNAPVVFSFITPDNPTIGTPINPVLTNITVYALSRPDLFGRTNHMYGQRLKLSAPVEADDAATMGWVSNLVAGVSYLQNDGVFLSGSKLNYSSEWSMIGGTNGLAMNYLGTAVLTVRPPPIDLTTITAISMTNTVVWVRIWTNGVSTAPAPQWSPRLNNPIWQTISSYTNTYPTASGTNYTISFQRPDPNMAFIRVARATTLPNFVDLAAMLLTAPRTVTNASDSTWGNGAGVVTWDTNYIYISVGTNSWKRASLSSW